MYEQIEESRFGLSEESGIYIKFGNENHNRMPRSSIYEFFWYILLKNFSQMIKHNTITIEQEK